VLVTVAIVAIGLATFLFFAFINARHPERKIQKNRVNATPWRELRYAPGSIVVIALCFAGGLFAQGQGWALAPLPLTWWTGPLLLVASMILYDTWFYWVHRLLHWKPFYRFHAQHHTSITPTVLTNHHETIFEAVLNQSFYLLIVFVLPIPWPMLIVQKVYDQISGMLGHAGYEHFASPGGRWPFPLASTVFHDQHHGYFRFNYGHSFSVWDRMLGTLHPSYDETVARFERIIACGSDEDTGKAA
jgi:sterol desaturase/sphingolipid hydroxylase (fatty acid hydroxylase superfamily)